MPSDSSRSQMREDSTRRRQTWVPATAVTAHVKHQPLQWNIGSVQRYFVSKLIPVSTTSPIAFTHAPRWEYMTPLGRPVVFEDVADFVGGEPDIDRDQDAARQRDAVVRLEHRGSVRADERDPVVFLHARLAEPGGQAVHALLELPVGVFAASVNDRRLVGEDVGVTLEEAYRRQLGPVDIAMLH